MIRGMREGITVSSDLEDRFGFPNFAFWKSGPAVIFKGEIDKIILERARVLQIKY